MEVVIGSVAAMLVVVLVIAVAGRHTRRQNNASSDCAQPGAKDEEVMLI